MIEVKDGKATLRGGKIYVMAETVAVLRALKEEVSEEEYKKVIRLADKSEKQLNSEAEKARGTLKKLLGL